MVPRWALVALALMLVPLAGCAGDDNDKTPPAEVVPGSTQKVEVTKTTGAIRGLVIDETIKPVEGVTVELTGTPESTVTAADGGFVFNSLEPGDYFVSARKAGFQTIQTSANVVAGETEPELLKISLPRLSGPGAAYANTQQWQGFTQCAVSVVYAFAQVCGVLDERFIHDFAIDGIPTFMQAEMVWKSTQPVTPKLQLNYYKELTTDWKSIAGDSPLVLSATGAEFVEAKGEDATSNPMRVSPPYLQCTSGPTEPTTCDPQTVAILNVNQSYDVFLTQFYGFTPREGWLFMVDGPCTNFDECGGAYAAA